ncbi:MAG: hypothetical protein HY649_02465 [Acidobacteria bacterium]|nr:hypothetical protein [Acidobacteriota bacterium]
MSKMWRAWLIVAVGLTGMGVSSLAAGRLPNHHWEVLAVAYPPDREVSVVLGGAERSLTAKGLGKVKWRDNVATMEIAVENLPAPGEVGKPGQQYVLWAVDSERRVVNLGLVPWRDQQQAKWQVQVPFRIFGLLVTAEDNPQAEVPGAAVALESLLPTDPFLIVPVFRVDVALAPPAQG